MELQPTRADMRIAWLAALAIAIHVAEAALPTPLPGVKPGLANVITLLVLLQFGPRDAAWVALLRVLVGSLLLGTFLSPTFLLSLTGTVANIAVLWAAHALSRGPGGTGGGLGPVGYSVLGALAHMGGQFAVAWTVFIPHPGLLHLLPVLLTAALAFGVLSGIIARMVLNRLSPQPC